MKFLSLIIAIVNMIAPMATVNKIDNNMVNVEVCDNNIVTSIDIPLEDFNHNLFEGNQFEVSSTIGDFEWYDGNDWYQFKSYDNKVWWYLSVNDIGFVPEKNKTYKLIYYNNQTTDCFDCHPKYECECEVYDDIFLTIYPLITHDREIDGIYNNGLITTSDGHIWKYVDDSLKNNSSVKVIINDNGTNIIDDDIIKEVKDEI